MSPNSSLFNNGKNRTLPKQKKYNSHQNGQDGLTQQKQSRTKLDLILHFRYIDVVVLQICYYSYCVFPLFIIQNNLVSIVLYPMNNKESDTILKIDLFIILLLA